MQAFPSQPLCDTCKTYHPIDPTNSCKNQTGIDDNLSGVFSRQLNNIISSQISSKNIKNQKKFFNHIILTVTKEMENFKE